MKSPRRWMYVLGLLVATGAAGCGTESPTGPSFARTAPPVESAVARMPMSEEPGSAESGTWTADPAPGAVDARTGKKAKKEKNPRHAGGHN